jgi:hypothetical protein
VVEDVIAVIIRVVSVAVALVVAVSSSGSSGSTGISSSIVEVGCVLKVEDISCRSEHVYREIQVHYTF